jgi:hypothetical protein
MRCRAIDFAEYGDVLYAQFAARAQNPHGNFPAIGDKDFLEHSGVCNLRECSTQAVAVNG